METQKLSTVEKVGFGAGDMALNVVISSMMLIITFFYTDIYGLKTTDLALLFVAVKVVGAIADLVMGSEGEGMRRLTRDTCDILVSIPMFGSVESLNVSVASGVSLYEARRQRIALEA